MKINIIHLYLKTLNIYIYIYIVSMTDLGILYRFNYDFDNAAPLYSHCYANAIDLYGEDHPTTAIFRNNLANLLTDQVCLI